LLYITLVRKVAWKNSYLYI